MGDKKIIVTTGTEHIISGQEERALLDTPDFLSALLPGISQQDLSAFMRAMPQYTGPDWHPPLTEPTYVAVPVNVEEDDEDGWIWDINIDHIICKETEHYYGEPTEAESDEYLNKALKSINKHIDLFKTDNPPTSLPDVAHIIGVTATKRRLSDPPTPHPAAEQAKAGKGGFTPEQAEYYFGFKRDKKPVPNAGKKEEENADSTKYTPSAASTFATTVTGVNPTPAENKSTYEHRSGLYKDERSVPDVGKKDGREENPDSIYFGKKVSPEFRVKAKSVARNIGVDVNYLMTIMAFESGGTFSPSVKNKLSSATGLIQFMKSTAEGLGTTTDDLAKMTAVEQLDFVEKYLKPYKGKLHTLEDAYMAVLMPPAIGKPNDYAVFRKSDKKTGKDYEKNKGLDTNHDGEITKSEISARLRAKYEQGKRFEN